MASIVLSVDRRRGGTALGPPPTTAATLGKQVFTTNCHRVFSEPKLLLLLHFQLYKSQTEGCLVPAEQSVGCLVRVVSTALQCDRAAMRWRT